jgi:hypothetical protein
MIRNFGELFSTVLVSNVLTDGESANFSIESISFNTADDRFFILDATEITRAWQSAIPAVID